jgi:hypothetical protein
MKRLFGFTLLLVLAFYVFPQIGNRIVWSTPAPTFREVQNEIRSWTHALRFESPEPSPLSIPYLQILAVRLEAGSVPAHLPFHRGQD